MRLASTISPYRGGSSPLLIASVTALWKVLMVSRDLWVWVRLFLLFSAGGAKTRGRFLRGRPLLFGVMLALSGDVLFRGPILGVGGSSLVSVSAVF